MCAHFYIYFMTCGAHLKIETCLSVVGRVAATQRTHPHVFYKINQLMLIGWKIIYMCAARSSRQRSIDTVVATKLFSLINK